MSVERVSTVSYATAGFGNRLTQDLASGAAAAREFFPAREWRSVAALIDQREYPREHLYQILRDSAARMNAHPASRANIERLREPRTYAIATGQQAGLAGGPLFTLYKSLTTIKLARSLQEQEERAGGTARFVPVFWLAGDDHDQGEIDHADFLARDRTVRRIRVDFGVENAGRSACDVTLDSSQLIELRKALQDLFPDESWPAAVADTYAASTVCDAFASLLNTWLGPLGLVIVHSRDVRVLAGNILRRTLDEYEVIDRLVQSAGTTMEQRGYSPGFPPRQVAGIPFFITTQPGRIRARLEPKSGAGQAAEYRESSSVLTARGIKPHSYTRKELDGLIASAPERFSAAAALRPILQQSVFPVAVAVLGPGEIDYWAQLNSTHDYFAVPFPVVVPRATLTLIDNRTLVDLRRLGVSPDAPEIFSDGEPLKQRWMASDALSQKIVAHSAAVLAEFDRLAADVHAVDKGLNPLFEKTRRRFECELERIAVKTAFSISQHEGADLGRVRRIVELIRPRHAPQERVLSWIQFAASKSALAAELLEVIDPDLGLHQVVALGD